MTGLHHTLHQHHNSMVTYRLPTGLHHTLHQHHNSMLTYRLRLVYITHSTSTITQWSPIDNRLVYITHSTSTITRWSIDNRLYITHSTSTLTQWSPIDYRLVYITHSTSTLTQWSPIDNRLFVHHTLHPRHTLASHAVQCRWWWLYPGCLTCQRHVQCIPGTDLFRPVCELSH